MRWEITGHDKAVPLVGTAITLMLGGVMFYVGCTALETERGRLRTAIDTWATVKNAAADAWEAGRLDRAQKKTVMEWTRKGDEALDLWRTRLEEGGPTAGPRERLLRATRILRKVWLATRDTHDGDGPEAE